MIVDKTVKYAKEAGDVGVALRDMVADIKAGKTLAQIGVENVPTIMAAVEGSNQIGGEVEENKQAAYATMGYHSGEITAILLTKKEEPEVPVSGAV